ncbi:MAG: S8 family serine peptidase [Anaerolineae bacterium]
MSATSLRRVVLSTLLLVLVWLLGIAGTASGNAPERPDAQPRYKPEEILVAFEAIEPASGPTPEAHSATIAALLKTHRATQVGTVFGSEVQVWRVPRGNELSVSRALSEHPAVRYAEPNYIYSAFAAPNDPGFASQWAFLKIRAPQAWDIGMGSSTLTIAIIDTGIDSNHPDLASKVVSGYDFIDGDNAALDLNGHGTHVAGIAAAATNNGVGVVGMAWGTKIMPLRVLDAKGDGNSADVAAAVDWARMNGAKIINLSLGGSERSETLQDAINRAHNAGLLVVAAMGNGPTSTPYYPAAYTNVMAVAATDINDGKAPYSNTGAHCDIAAPGGALFGCHSSYGIYSTLPIYEVYLTNPASGLTCTYYREYDYMQGTSQAAPFVSGLAALLWSLDPSLTPDEVQTTIQATAVDLGDKGWDSVFGHGRIDALSAVEALLSLPAPTLYAVSDPDRDASYTISWSEVDRATSYWLEEADNAAFESPASLYNGSNTQTSVTERPFGTWYYRVRAERSTAGLVSAWSNTQSIVVGLDAPTLQPISNNGAKDYQIEWGSVTGASGYRLQESASSTFESFRQLYVGPSLVYSVTNQTAGAWYYRVKAYNDLGDSAWSASQSAVVIPNAPALVLDATSPDPDAYTLIWTSRTGATSYRLQESADSVFSHPVTRYLGTSTGYPVTGQPNGHWYYRVQAYNSAGFSPSSEVKDVVISTTMVTSPTLYAIPNPNNSQTYIVTWRSVPTATQYVLEESASPYFEAPTIAYTGTLTYHTAIHHWPGRWHYRVRAYAPSGNSPWSNTEAVFVKARAYLPMIAREAVTIEGGAR